MRVWVKAVTQTVAIRLAHILVRNSAMSDHAVRFDVKEILGRKLQRKTNFMLTEVGLLKKWHSELSVTGFQQRNIKSNDQTFTTCGDRASRSFS